MASKVILIGAGALARDFIDAFGPEAFAGMVVDPQYAVAPVHGVPVYTDWHDALRVATHYVLAVSDIAHRVRAIALAEAQGLLPAPPMVAKSAIVARDAVLEAGACVGHLAVLGPNAHVGANSLVMHGVVVGHDTVIGANSVLCAAVSVGGNAVVGARCFVGANAMLAPRVRLGDEVYVAAAAACFRDAEAGSRWIGNPARRSKIGA